MFIHLMKKTYKNSLNKMHYKLIFSSNYILYTVKLMWYIKGQNYFTP